MKVPSFLLIDDNAIALRELTNILKYLGYKDLHESSSGTEAWAMLRVKNFGCVISTWDMAEMTGLALLKIIRYHNTYAELPFYLADYTFTKPMVINAGRAGVSGLLIKPYQLETVEKKIKEMAEEKGLGVPKEMQVSFDEGLRLLEVGDYEHALEVFEQLLEEGESADIYYNIGYIKTIKGDYAGAIESFRKATQLNRMFAKAYEAMGRAYKELGQTERAEKALNKAAEIYLSKGKEEDAEEVLNEILRVNPDTINVYNTLGVLHRRKGNYQTALKQYERALRIHPEEPNIYYNIGRLHTDLGDLEQAESHFKKALALDPGFKEAGEALDAIVLGTV